MRIVAIIAAGGRGERLGHALPKQMIEIGGRTILQRSVDALAASDRIDEIVAVLPADIAANPPSWLAASKKRLRVVTGGTRRQDSVANGVAALDDDIDVVVIHDAARPFVSAGLIANTIDAAIATGAALAALPARDTVKHAEADEGAMIVRATLPRDMIYLAQTPQAFRMHVLRDAIAHGAGAGEVTDEAMLVERMGGRVALVTGERANIKITTPEDLAFARAMLAGKGDTGLTGQVKPGAFTSAGTQRIGTGYDLHRLVEGRPLILGGVTIPFERGLLGHSDADVLCHAVTDALLGAAAAGDIGRHFPDTDPRWKDASSIALLQHAGGVVRARGYAVANVDAVIVAERPKLLPFVKAMREALASALQVDAACIGIKGKTNEGVDAVGRGEAIAVHAVALLVLTPDRSA